MSLFKKPNRNIRRREIEVQEDDLESKEADIAKTKNKSNNTNSNSSVKAVKQTLLSFGEEWDEG